LALGAAPDHAEVGELGRPALEEPRLAALGLEQGNLPTRERGRQRDPGRPAARADVDDRAVEAADEVEPGQGVVEEDAAGLGGVPQRGQARRLQNGGEPALEEIRQRGRGG